MGPDRATPDGPCTRRMLCQHRRDRVEREPAMSRTFRVVVSVVLVLGAAVIVAPPASATSDACLYDGSTKIVTVIFPVPANQSRTVSRAPGGTAITYNGSACSAATVNNTKRIDVVAGTGNQ